MLAVKMPELSYDQEKQYPVYDNSSLMGLTLHAYLSLV